MSYILDALRKAEQERQTKRTPDLHSVQQGSVAPKKSPSRWLWIGVVLVAIIAINTAVWLWQSRGSDNSTPVARVQNETPSAQESRAAPLQREVPVQAEASLQAAGAARQRPVQQLWQVASHIKAAVQDLKFSFHVYSSKPQRRTIIINGHRMREGDRITADLTLEEITKDGVILSHPDTLVNVSILEQW